jgi:type IV pilus assembly protein PilA
MIGMMASIAASIAIPAYQMYTVRAQVAQGLMLAKPLENAVAEHYRQQHRWPVELLDLGISQPPSSQYVSTIGLDHGTVSITYGNRANRLIAGHSLTLRPTIRAGRIAWSCGYADIGDDDPVAGAAEPSRTDIDAKDLPAACHSDQRPRHVAIASPVPASASSAAPNAAAHEAPAADSAANISVDIPDSMAVTQQLVRMRMQAVRQQIRSGARPTPPILGRCLATIPIDDAGVPAPDFPITCNDPRVADILRRAISTAGTRHARPGTTVLLRVLAPFPPS